MIERRFRAMGSDAHVIVVGGPNGLVDTAAARIEDLEAKWSRFRPSSEVCRLTAAAGAWVDVSADTTLLVRRSIDAWYLTGASFDPTVLGAMLDAGYDRTFETLRTAGGEPVDVRRPRFSLVGCTDIGVEDRRVRLPADCGFDAGGIGKGLAADLVAEELMAAGAEGVLMSLGGDLRVDGVAPDGGTWTISIDHPHQAEPIVLLGLRRGAVATSTTLRRRWAGTDGEQHHLIDPVTGRPSLTDVGLSSVVTGEAWRAEVLAKAVLLRGMARAFDLMDGPSAEALVVGSDGRVAVTAGFDAFLGVLRAPSRIG